MPNILFKSAILLYFLATLHYLIYLLLPKQHRVTRIAISFTIIGFGCHTLTLILKSVSIGNLPLVGSTDILSFLAWTIMLVYLLLEWHYKTGVFGSFVLPLTFLATLYASLLPQQIEPIISSAKRVFLTAHISLAIIGFASFALACCMGIMYLIQERQLKSHKPGYLFYRLPSLDTLDRLSYRCISIGFPILTISVILGLIAVASTRSSIFSWKAVEIWWMLIWVLYAILLQARFTMGWRGRKASYLAIVMFVLALLPLLR
jgi:cytochrome c-type biogenesis protein CcsB